MVFEKSASSWDSVKWGGWGQGSTVVMRVKISLETDIVSAHVVSCNVFYVTDSGNRVFEDEHRLMFLHGRPYQKLLDEASRRFKLHESPCLQRTH